MTTLFAKAKWRAAFVPPQFFSPKLGTTKHDVRKDISTPLRIRQPLPINIEERKLWSIIATTHFPWLHFLARTLRSCFPLVAPITTHSYLFLRSIYGEYPTHVSRSLLFEHSLFNLNATHIRIVWPHACPNVLHVYSQLRHMFALSRILAQFSLCSHPMHPLLIRPYTCEMWRVRSLLVVSLQPLL